MTTAHLFSGIGGFALAADWMGWETAFHCEWDPFCQTVLKYHWPQAEIYGDITKTDFTLWRGRIDLLTGGFPCQPFSTAGQRKGTADDRYLWPQMLRAIREIAPRFIVGENVAGIYTWNNGLVFETVCADLENEGYEVTPLCIPACATGAPHRRDRWWFVAHANGAGHDRTQEQSIRHQQASTWNANNFSDAISGIAENTPHPHHLRQPQPGGPLREIGRRTGHEAGDAPNPSSQGLSQPRQTGLEQLPAESERRLHHRPQLDHCHTANGSGASMEGRSEQGRPISQGRQIEDGPVGERSGAQWHEHWVEAATRLCRLDDGLPGRLDTEALSCNPRHTAGKWRKESLKAYGNAIVPQIAYQIYQAIAQTMTNE